MISKEKKREYTNNYIKKHGIDKIRKQGRKSYRKNREKRLDYEKEKYQSNNSFIKNRMQNYRKNNPKKIKEQSMRYYDNNKEKIKKYQKSHRKKYPERKKQQDKNYVKNNLKKVQNKRKEYYHKNKRVIIFKQLIYNRKRYKNNKNYIIATRLRGSVGNAFRNYTKTGKIMTSKKYGIDYEAIIRYLKPFPVDLNEWHIDHIKPLCKFNFINPDGSTNLEEVKKAFAPNNHQWLLAKDNLIKSGKWDEKEW